MKLAPLADHVWTVRAESEIEPSMATHDLLQCGYEPSRTESPSSLTSGRRKRLRLLASERCPIKLHGFIAEGLSDLTKLPLTAPEMHTVRARAGVNVESFSGFKLSVEEGLVGNCLGLHLLMDIVSSEGVISESSWQHLGVESTTPQQRKNRLFRLISGETVSLCIARVYTSPGYYRHQYSLVPEPRPATNVRPL